MKRWIKNRLASSIFLIIVIFCSCSNKRDSKILFKPVKLNNRSSIYSLIGLKDNYTFSNESDTSLVDKKIIEFLFLKENIGYHVDSARNIYFNSIINKNGYDSDLDFMWKMTQKWKEIKTKSKQNYIPKLSCKIDSLNMNQFKGVIFFGAYEFKDSVCFNQYDLGFSFDNNNELHYYSIEDIYKFYRWIDFVMYEGKCLKKRYIVLKIHIYQPISDSLLIQIKNYGKSKNVILFIKNMNVGYFNKGLTSNSLF